MSITDELREWGGRWEDVIEHEVEEIADRIDAEHKKGLRELNGYASVSVLLPRDADGEVIRLGDEMELTDEAASRWDGDKYFGKVMELELAEDGWTVEGEPAANLRHVQPDSWERIIADATAYRKYDKAPCSISELVERCRRLAGEAE